MKITRKFTIVDENSPQTPAKKAPVKAKAPAKPRAKTTRKKAAKSE